MFHWLNRLIQVEEGALPADDNKFVPVFDQKAKFLVFAGGRYIKSKYDVYLRTRWTDATFYFCVLGVYGKALSDYLTAQTRPFSFIDIGANQGLYSLLAARNAACNQVFAFEPVSENHRYLTDNLQINGATSKTLAIKKAIAQNNGFYQICLKRGHSGAASLRPQKSTRSRSYETIETINANVLHFLLKFVERAIIKIDVEGFENTVINELGKSGILARTEAVFYEIDERWTVPEQICQQLAAYGFETFQQFGIGSHYDVLATRSRESADYS